MPEVGESCDVEDAIVVSSDKQVLVCRRGKWARHGSVPTSGGAMPTRELAADVVEAQRKTAEAARPRRWRRGKADEARGKQEPTP